MKFINWTAGTHTKECKICFEEIRNGYPCVKIESKETLKIVCLSCGEKEKEKWEQEEKLRKDREHKISHCCQCNTKSTFFHYIYDKRTGKVKDSWSNATDPENQLVFCNKDCFDKYCEKKFTSACHECHASIKPNQTHWPLKSNKNIKFCSQSCGKNYLNKQAQKETDKLNDEINDLNKQQLNNLIQLMKVGGKLDFDFESASWLNEKQKQICRDYVKKWQEGEELKKGQPKQGDEESDNYSDDSDNSNDQKKCSECGKNETRYRNKATNDGKEFCSKDCFAKHYQTKQSPTNQNSNSEQDISDRIDEILSPSDNSDNKNKNSPPPNKDKKKLKKMVNDKILEDLKIKIKTGEASVAEIADEYDLSSKQREELNESEINKSLHKENKPFYRQPGIIIGAVVIVLLSLIIIVKKRIKQNRIKKTK